MIPPKKGSYTEIRKLHAFRIFKKHSLNLLTETIGSFLGCKVEVYVYPKRDISTLYGINITDNIYRGIYILDDNRTIMLGRIFKDGFLISAIGFLLTGINAKKSEKLLNIFENRLTHSLTNEFNGFFKNSSLLFGDELVKHAISGHISNGYYDSRQIQHLIEYFFKLRTTSFEGKYFSTGAIFTKTQDLLNGTIDDERLGKSKSLTNPFFINDTNKINKRIWYLVDGKTTFFLGNKNLCFNKIFIINEQYLEGDFLNSYSLSSTLKGGDFLIKVENEKSMSVITSKGIEFSFFENKWKYRNYSLLKDILENNIPRDSQIINALVFIIMTCSKSQISTILWFPNNLDTIDDYVNTNTKNNFLIEKVNIVDKSSINYVFRCLSSDGATIIEKDGNIKHIGVIVDISKATANGITGTGESAASVLSSNGLSIKISQDGIIKIFTQTSSEPYLF